MTKQTITLNDIAQIQLGKAFKKAVEDAGQSGDVNVIQIGDLNNGNYERPNKLISIKNENDISRFFINQGDILLPLRGNIIRGVAINANYSKPVITSNQVAVISCKAEICETYYLAWYLNSDEFFKYISKSNEGTNISKLSSSQLKKMPVKLPPIETQIYISKIYKNWLYQRSIHLELVERGEYLYNQVCKRILE